MTDKKKITEQYQAAELVAELAEAKAAEATAAAKSARIKATIWKGKMEAANNAKA